MTTFTVSADWVEQRTFADTLVGTNLGSARAAWDAEGYDEWTEITGVHGHGETPDPDTWYLGQLLIAPDCADAPAGGYPSTAIVSTDPPAPVQSLGRSPTTYNVADCGSSLIADELTGESNSSVLGMDITVGSESNRALYLIGLVRTNGDIEDTDAVWYPSFVDLGNPGTGHAMTLLDSVSISLGHLVVFRLLAPATSTQPTSKIQFSHPSGLAYQAGAWALTGVNQTTPERDTSTSSGSGASSSVSVGAVSGDLVLDAAGWLQANAVVTTPTATGGQNVTGSETFDAAFGQADMALGAGSGSGSTPTWSFTTSHPWAAAAVAVRSA